MHSKIEKTGDSMQNSTRIMKKFSKGFVSVLLVLAILISLAVPFDLTAYAEGEEEPATGDDWGEKATYEFEPTGDCTLYARWAEKKWTVNFDARDGELYLPADACAATIWYRA